LNILLDVIRNDTQYTLIDVKCKQNKSGIFLRVERIKKKPYKIKKIYLLMRNYLNRQYVSVKVQQVVLTSNVSQRETNLGE